MNDIWSLSIDGSSFASSWTLITNNAPWLKRRSFAYVVVPPYGAITSSTIVLMGGLTINSIVDFFLYFLSFYKFL